MTVKKSYHANQLRDYSSLFSRSEVNRWLKCDLSSVDLKIKRYDIKFSESNKTYLSYLKHVYRVLEQFYPNEYVYKNELINKVLIQELSSCDSVVFNEFRLGKAIADLTIFNGISKVFEIKTTLDKNARLESQISEYHKLFNEIYLIVPDGKLESYWNLYPNIGIIAYEECNQEFRVVKEATFKISIDIDILMRTLHTNEYIKLVEQYYGQKPIFTDFNKFDVCKRLIEKIPQNELNTLFIGIIKKRRIFNAFSTAERQLNQIFLSLNLSSDKQKKLLAHLKSKINI